MPFGDYWVVETTTPAGYTTAADQSTTISPTVSTVSLSFVDPRIVPGTTITTAQSFVPNDSATVVVGSTTQGDLLGNVVFQLYDNATCTGTPLYDSGKVAVANSGTSATVTSDNKVAYTASGTTTFSWLVTYTSDNTGHKDVSSACDVEHSSITINNTNTP